MDPLALSAEASPLLVKSLLVLVFALISVIVALIAAALARHNTGRWSTAVMHASGAFAASFSMLLIGLNTLWQN
ncbi:hypothetical protein [Nocardia sp. NPDC051832]|uniref:hypothetical protein n=1 Tax=Nocardia sp. NPDC051832 TaxID=3155673 RepID=UPI00342DD3B6